MKNIFLILFLVVFNTGCVATYKGESSSIKLDNNVFKVSFERNFGAFSLALAAS